MKYHVRQAEQEDLLQIEAIYAHARDFMARSGNPNQWGSNYPPQEQLLEDIKNRTLYVITHESIIHGVFFFWIGPDPTYAVIEQGNWRMDAPYGTIHRIAGDGRGGILKTAVEFASSRISHLRMDTHKDNLVMQKALHKQGFQERGIIYLPDKSERIAYDRI